MNRWLLLAAGCWLALPRAGAQIPFRLMAYNVENLFDTRPDSLKDDREFLPDAARSWTPSRYWQKLDKVAKVVAAVGQECLPALVALCEVENDSVLHDLTCRSSLRTAGYRYVMTDSPDRRGIDVALLYQPGLFRLLHHRALGIPSESYGFSPTRDILYACGTVQSGDTLHVFVCHFPSRAGDTRQGARHRLLAARTLQAAVDSLYKRHSDARVLVAGDFNAALGDAVFRRCLRVERLPDGLQTGVPKPAVGDGKLYATDPAARKQRRQPLGSYRYRGEWTFLDHVLVSGNLLDSLATLFCRYPVELRVADFPFLLEEDRTYGGVRPFRTYLGPVYRGGYSDHLPVYLDLVCRRRRPKRP